MEFNENSTVYSFDFDRSSIRLWFTDGLVVEFTNKDVGSVVIEQLKQRAINGNGLNSYLRSSKVIAQSKPRTWIEAMKR